VAVPMPLFLSSITCVTLEIIISTAATAVLCYSKTNILIRKFAA
jgi:hypothetical protein